MQPGPADSTGVAAPTAHARAAWILASISYCASIAGFMLVAMSFALGSAALKANPTCASNTPAVQMEATLRIEWLAGAVCVVIAWLGVWFARRARAEAGVPTVSRAGRAAWILSALALVGLILSFCSYTDFAFAACIG